MCKKLIYLIPFVFVLGSVSNAEDIQWTDLGADHLWSTPENWDLGRVPTLADEVRIDVPAAGAPNGPVIQDGSDAKAKGIFNEAPGEPTLTMTGGTLEVAEWIWWGDGADSFGIWDMSGGTVDVTNEFELGWDGGAGTLTMTGGTINAGEAVIPTGSGAFGELFLNGGTYNVTKPGGLSVKENGLIDITEGTLVLEGDETAKVNDLIAAGLITAYGGAGQFELDFDGRNPGKTTVTAIPAPEPVDPGTDGLVAHYAFENDANDSSGNDLHGTLVGNPNFVEGMTGMALNFDGTDDVVELGKFDVVGGITLATWIKADDFGINDARIISKANEWAGDSHWWMLSTMSETSLRFRLKTDEGPGTATLISDPVLEAGVWTHVVATWDGSMMRIYKDGIEVASQEKGGSAVAVDPAISAAIGSQPSDAFASDPSHVAKFFDGLIDEVRIYERALSEGEVMFLAGKRATPVDPGSDGLVAYYPLDNDVLDASGNGNDGIVEGDPNYVEGPAGYGMALDLDGDDWVNIGTPPDLVITEAITITCWVNPAEIGGEQGFAGLDAGYAFKAHGEGVRFTTPGILDHSSTNITLEAGIWQHVAAVFQPGQSEGLVFYLNGVETERITSSAINPGTGPFRIGSNQWNETLTGLIDEVVIYNRALSAGEVMYLAGFREMVDPGTDGLVAYYPLDNDANDSSGNGHDGTIGGTPNWVVGMIDGALDFDGATNYIDMDDRVVEGTFSLTMWLKPRDIPYSSDYYAVMHNDEWNSGATHVHLRNTTSLFNVDINSGPAVTSTTVLQADEWYHCAVTVTNEGGNASKLYIDGVLESTGEGGSGTAYLGPLNFGAWNNSGRYYHGLMDDIRIYDRVLSEAEVLYLADEREVDPSLVIYYSFDEVSDIVADQSGKGHDGVVVGDVTAEPEGMYNGAANFTSGSYLDLDGASFPAEDIPTSAMTLAAWIKCVNTGGDHEIFSARASDNTWLIHPEPKSSGDIRWLLRSYGGTTIFQIRAGTMTWDEWLHFAGTYDKDSGKAALYINGELIEEIVVENPADIAGDWGLGARVGYTIDNARPFTGLMDEFRMYTRALSQDEILTIMQGM